MAPAATRPWPSRRRWPRRAPGTEIYFLRGDYQGCFELTRAAAPTTSRSSSTASATRTSRSASRSTAARSGRQTCFNFENADYIAIDGFELIGGKYGVRVVGAGYAASEHSRGIAVLNCKGHDQARDPFFSGQSDWAVWEGNRRLRRQEGRRPRHLSQQRRRLEHRPLQRDVRQRLERLPDQRRPDLHLQGGRHPLRRSALRRLCRRRRGGQGASDYFLVDGNYFHHSNGRAELHQRAPQRRPQQHLRAAGTAQRQLLAGDRQPEARLQRQQDPAQSVHHDRAGTA